MRVATAVPAVSAHLGQHNLPDSERVSKTADARLSRPLRLAVHVRLVLARLTSERRIWAAVFRSSRGHIQMSHARGSRLGSPGLAVGFAKDGNLRLNRGSIARSLYIGFLHKVLPWSGDVEFEIFLTGFHAGATWACHSADIENEHIDGSTQTWFTPEDARRIHAEAERAEFVP